MNWPKARVRASSSWAVTGRQMLPIRGRGLLNIKVANTRVSSASGRLLHRSITAGGSSGKGPLGANSRPMPPASRASGTPQRFKPMAAPMAVPISSNTASSPRARGHGCQSAPSCCSKAANFSSKEIITARSGGRKMPPLPPTPNSAPHRCGSHGPRRQSGAPAPECRWPLAQPP